MSFHSLPQELLNQTLEALRDKVDLRSCCLVSSQWFRSARPLLFAKLCVRGDKPNQGFEECIAFLDSVPAVCDTVKTLSLEGGRYPRAGDRPAISRGLLLAFLSRLSRLQSLRLKAVRFSSPQPSSDISTSYDPHDAVHYNIDQLFMDAVGSCNDDAQNFLHCLGIFSHIQSLEINTLSPLRGLPSFRLSNASAAITEFRDKLQIPEHVGVSHLRLNNISDVEFLMDVFSRTRTVHMLNSFAFDFVACKAYSGVGLRAGVSEFVGAAGSHLEHLTVDMTSLVWLTARDLARSRQYTSQFLRSVIAASNLTALRSLTFRIAVSVWHQDDEWWLTDIWDIFVAAVSSFPPHLRRLEFVLSHGAAIEGIIPHFSLWCLKDFNLHALRMGMQHYTELESVTFRKKDKLEDEEKQRITSAFKEMTRKGLIKFEV